MIVPNITAHQSSVSDCKNVFLSGVIPASVKAPVVPVALFCVDIVFLCGYLIFMLKISFNTFFAAL
ncbi:hypothetical protein D3C85_921980 [compost metagenome]